MSFMSLISHVKKGVFCFITIFILLDILNKALKTPRINLFSPTYYFRLKEPNHPRCFIYFEEKSSLQRWLKKYL